MVINKVVCDFCGKEEDARIESRLSNKDNVVIGGGWRTLTGDESWNKEHMCPDCYKKLKEV